MRTISAKGLRAAALAGLSLLALAAATAARAEDKAEATDVDQLVVTAARTILPASALPLTVDVIDSEALSQQVGIGGSIVDAVSTLSPSFSPTRQKLSGAGETLRGRSPLYAINGIPQSTPIRDGSRDGYTIDPFFIDRVEVIYGSNALQGIGATGGVVNQVTVGPPRADGVSGKVLTQVTAGHDLGDSVGGKIAGLVAWRGGAFDATAGVAYDARGAYYDADGRRLGMDNTQGDVQDSKALSFFTRLGWQLGDNTRLDVVANRFELKGDGDYVTTTISARNPVPATNGDRVAHLPTTSFRGVQPGEPAANRVETVSASLTNTDLAGGNLIAQLFFNRSRDTFGGDVNDTFQDVAIAPKGTLFDQSSNRSRKLGARVSYERAVPGIKGLTGTVGVDAINDRTEQLLIETGRAWVPPTKFQSVAPFVQGNLSLLDDKVHFAGGVRFENVELKVDDFTTLAFYGSRKVAGGNPDFKATLVNGGIVVEPVHGMRFWSASKLGQLLVKNSGGIFDVQRQRVEIEGLEANVKARTPVPGLVVSAGYAHLKGRTDADKDGKVDTDLDGANISPDRLNLAADYQGDTWGLRVQIQSYIKRDMQDALVKDDFTGYTLADAFVRYKLPMGALSLGVQNLFDSQYISYNSDTTAPAVDRYFAGRGRTATLGWEARF
ncbi:MAG: TonB-dependent receptor plug domain-containing protein [Burkholderiales bacterium]|nr:TonB-dependent receptor plug domain-containing protein [Burkholderiales bacterium]